MPRAISGAVAFLSLVISHAAIGACSGTLYLTVDTGSMSQADLIAATLNKHQVKATFFIANEKTVRGDYSLDDSWGDYWRARVKEGHAFGSHTWRHWHLQRDVKNDHIFYLSMDGMEHELLDRKAFCEDLQRPAVAFEKMTGWRLLSRQVFSQKNTCKGFLDQRLFVGVCFAIFLPKFASPTPRGKQFNNHSNFKSDPHSGVSNSPHHHQAGYKSAIEAAGGSIEIVK